MKPREQIEQEIRLLAYELYEKSGRIPGRDLENWLEAEKIIMNKYRQQSQGQTASQGHGSSEEQQQMQMKMRKGRGMGGGKGMGRSKGTVGDQSGSKKGCR
ncbi:MAG: DUF2934 domain-containing protein [Candidatus Saccharicenans sp.]